jgi:lysophospholipid acyltransferase 1/2
VAVYCFLVRCQYYFSHLIVESISNAGGLGFNGYDEDKNAKWDLVQNVDVYKFELGTNIREQTLAWNITTQTWLKRVVYERFKWSPVFFTCLVSAVWHGFYPGYYYSFLLVGLVTVGARKIRILLWHHFQEPQWVKLIYDIASTLLTNIGKDLVVLSFWMLTLENVHALWSNYNYCMFFPVILVTILLPNKRRAKSHQA